MSLRTIIYKNMKIYTLDWIEKEANLIAPYWNGRDEKFVDGTGEPRTKEKAQIASELLGEIKQVRALIEELGI